MHSYVTEIPATCLYDGNQWSTDWSIIPHDVRITVSTIPMRALRKRISLLFIPSLFFFQFKRKNFPKDDDYNERIMNNVKLKSFDCITLCLISRY